MEGKNASTSAQAATDAERVATVDPQAQEDQKKGQGVGIFKTRRANWVVGQGTFQAMGSKISLNLNGC